MAVGPFPQPAGEAFRIAEAPVRDQPLQTRQIDACGQNIEPNCNMLLLNTFRPTEDVNLGRLTCPDSFPCCPFFSISTGEPCLSFFNPGN